MKDIAKLNVRVPPDKDVYCLCGYCKRFVNHMKEAGSMSK
jgi:hypothetical protein